MRILYKLLLFMAVCTYTSCENASYPVISDSEPLIGHWINPVYVDTILQYERSTSFKEDGAGIYFGSDNEFAERKNAGWCGTPPVSYANYEGNWTRKDSTLNITVGYWGGTVDYEWKIITVDYDKLKLYRVRDTYHYKE